MKKWKKEIIEAHQKDNFRKKIFRDFYLSKSIVHEKAKDEDKNRAKQFKVKADQLSMEIEMNEELVDFVENGSNRLRDLRAKGEKTQADPSGVQEADGQDDNPDK